MFKPPLSRNDVLALLQGATPIAIQAMKKTSQQNWNDRHPDKIKAAIATQDAKRTRVVLSFYSDRPDDMALLEWLKTQAGKESLAATVTKLLRRFQ